MNGKLQVRICSGTACYVQGGSYLFDIEERLTNDERSRVDIRGVSCLGCCSAKDTGVPPFASVGDTLLPQATIHSLTAEIRRQLRGGAS